MILDALAITVWVWGAETLPPDGFHTFVDARKVKPTISHSRRIYGWCFLKAGFTLCPERTKARDLLRLTMTSAQLRCLPSVQPVSEQQTFMEAAP